MGISGTWFIVGAVIFGVIVLLLALVFTVRYSSSGISNLACRTGMGKALPSYLDFFNAFVCFIVAPF
jgi:hypothetical protein